MFLVGLGQDSHQFSDNFGKKLVLGGIKVPGQKGLKGDSDGDVVIHAICRAIEQALGNPDFHTYARKMCQQGTTNSAEYLKKALSHIKEKKLTINNLGISFECKYPKILPLEKKMRNNLADFLKINKERIGINSSSGDSLTSFGKGEGIQVFAIVSLIKK